MRAFPSFLSAFEVVDQLSLSLSRSLCFTLLLWVDVFVVVVSAPCPTPMYSCFVVVWGICLLSLLLPRVKRRSIKKKRKKNCSVYFLFLRCWRARVQHDAPPLYNLLGGQQATYRGSCVRPVPVCACVCVLSASKRECVEGKNARANVRGTLAR